MYTVRITVTVSESDIKRNDRTRRILCRVPPDEHSTRNVVSRTGHVVKPNPASCSHYTAIRVSDHTVMERRRVRFKRTANVLYVYIDGTVRRYVRHHYRHFSAETTNVPPEANPVRLCGRRVLVCCWVRGAGNGDVPETA